MSARLGMEARALLSRFLVEGAIETLPFGEAHFGVAVGAWLRFGRGRHPAGLHFGDCLTYATARVAGRPLLCVGEDFGRTDLALAGAVCDRRTWHGQTRRCRFWTIPS